MTDTARINFVNWGKEDISFGDSTATFTQANRLQTDGTIANGTAHNVDSAVVPLSTAAKATLSLAGTKYVDDAISTLAASGAVSAATTTTQGKVKVDDNNAGNPIAVTTTGAGVRIPTVNVDNALDAALNPTASNEYMTLQRYDRIAALMLGSGKDGYGQFGTISGTPAAPTLADAGSISNSLASGTYYYEIQAYNLSGQGNASTPSSSITVTANHGVTLTLPALPANAMGWRIYRSTDAVNYYFVGQAVNGFNYFPSVALTFTDIVTYPNTSLTPPAGSSGGTATMSGRYEFITLDFTNATTITVATSGNYTGVIDCRVQGLFTPASGCTITAVGANRAVSRRDLASYETNAGGNPTGLVGQIYYATTFGPSAASYYNGGNSTTFGLGANLANANKLLSGYGVRGSTGFDGGWGGGFIRILCYQIAGNNLIGTYNATGQAGTNATGTFAQGGAGGSGGTIDLGSVVPWKDSATENAAGGKGGDAAGSGGASTIKGSPGGAGGLILRRNCVDTSAATASVAAGADGAQTTIASSASSAIVNAGAHYGNGGYTNGSAITSSTAGQNVTLNAFNDPSIIFAA